MCVYSESQHPAATVATLASAGLRFHDLGCIGTAAGLAVAQKELCFVYLKKLIQSLSCLVVGFFWLVVLLWVWFFFSFSKASSYKIYLKKEKKKNLPSCSESWSMR